jgi:hypothetical protein
MFCPMSWANHLKISQLLNTVAEFCLSGVPTETCRQLCWYVLVDTLLK